MPVYIPALSVYNLGESSSWLLRLVSTPEMADELQTSRQLLSELYASCIVVAGLTLVVSYAYFLLMMMTAVPTLGTNSLADAGMIDADGYISIMSRSDDLINTAGHRLSTGRTPDGPRSKFGVREATDLENRRDRAGDNGPPSRCRSKCSRDS